MPEARSGVVDNVRANGTSVTSTCADGPQVSEVPLNLINLVECIATIDRRSLQAQLRRLVILVGHIKPGGERRRELTAVQNRFHHLHAALDVCTTREREFLCRIVELLTPNVDSCDDVEDVDRHVATLAGGYEEVRTRLQELRRITSDFLVPSDGCPYESCYRALENLERDTHRHLDVMEQNLLPALQVLLASP